MIFSWNHLSVSTFQVIKFATFCADFVLELQTVHARYVLTCGGLQSDRLAQMSGCSNVPKIVPFRGEYLLLNPAKAHLIRGNIYPVSVGFSFEYLLFFMLGILFHNQQFLMSEAVLLSRLIPFSYMILYQYFQ